MKMEAYISAWTRRMLHKHLPLGGIMAMLLVGLTGCAEVYRTTPGSFASMDYKDAGTTPLEHVYITTTGYYCLWSIPLASGDLRWNAEKQSINGGTCLFRDQVSATELQNALLKIAESRDCDVIDIVFDDSDTSYAGVSYEGIIGLFFGSSHIGVSGVLVPKKRQPEVKEEGVE
jgi:hypothetical protein